MSIRNAAGRSLRVSLALVPTIALLGIAGCDDAAGPETGASPAQLLFVSNQGNTPSSQNIFRINEDGTGLVNLTEHPAPLYQSLALSPDGERIAFYSDRDGCYDIWTMGVDGSDLRKLTNLDPLVDDRCNHHPRWSPDGSRIAFTSTRESGPPAWAVYVMNADGTEPRNVSAPIGEAQQAASYAIPIGWSPDGRVVFHHGSGGDENWAPYLADPNGGNVVPLFEDPADGQPAWSPDGSRIAFIRELADGQMVLHVMSADGSGVHRLTDHEGRDRLPQRVISAYGSDYDPWSPDGSMIAFHSGSGTTIELFVINADGTELRQLTHSGGVNIFHGWSPDGGRIAFRHDGDIHTISADGSARRTVTASPAHDSEAIWLPDE